MIIQDSTQLAAVHIRELKGGDVFKNSHGEIAMYIGTMTVNGITKQRAVLLTSGCVVIVSETEVVYPLPNARLILDYKGDTNG